MNKILLSSAVAAMLASASFANTTSPFTGFYVGGGVTYNSSTNKIDGRAPILGPNVTFSSRGTNSGAGLLFFAGYGSVLCNNVYLGGELNLGIDGASRSKDINFGNGISFTKQKNNRFTSGVAARLGYAFGNVLPYVKVGYQAYPTYKYSNMINNVLANLTIKRSGFVLGGGVDYAVTKNVFLRAEYNYNFGSKSKFNIQNGAVLGNMRSNTHTFMIGAAYKF